jgi:hypothetical protein
MLPSEEHPTEHSFYRSHFDPWLRDRVLWAVAGVIVLFFLFLVSGGLYTITSPNGPVDTAYVMNRLTGKVWLVKTYTKQVGDVRVLAARQAEVEKTKDVAEDADRTSSVAMSSQSDRTDRFDRSEPPRVLRRR